MTTQSRIRMIDPDNCTDEQREVLEARGPQSRVNIFRLLANNPPFLDALIPLTTYIFQRSTLPARDREIMILRVGWVTQAEYVWGQHKRLALSAGVSESEIERVKKGADAEGWTAYEAALIRAVDELRRDSFITDATWSVLSRELSPPQLMDIIFAIGQTLMIASATKTLWVPLDEGLTGFA